MKVSPSQVPAYLRAAAGLAAALRRRGQHFWLFRHPTEPGRFLEFRESADGAAHTAIAPTPEEARLTTALWALRAPDPGDDLLWLEVSPAEGSSAADGSS